MWEYYSNDAYYIGGELYHHGVPGMKWGVRKARPSIGNSIGHLISGAARARSGYSNPNPQYNAGRMARNAVGNALKKRTYSHPKSSNVVSVVKAIIGRMRTNRVNVSGNEFQRISSSARKPVRKMLNSYGFKPLAETLTGNLVLDSNGRGVYSHIPYTGRNLYRNGHNFGYTHTETAARIILGKTRKRGGSNFRRLR